MMVRFGEYLYSILRQWGITVQSHVVVRVAENTTGPCCPKQRRFVEGGDQEFCRSPSVAVRAHRTTISFPQNCCSASRREFSCSM